MYVPYTMELYRQTLIVSWCAIWNINPDYMSNSSTLNLFKVEYLKWNTLYYLHIVEIGVLYFEIYLLLNITNRSTEFTPNIILSKANIQIKMFTYLHLNIHIYIYIYILMLSSE